MRNLISYKTPLMVSFMLAIFGSAASAEPLAEVSKVLSDKLSMKQSVSKMRYTTRERTKCEGPPRRIPCSVKMPVTGVLTFTQNATPMCVARECYTYEERVQYMVQEPLIATNWELKTISAFHTLDAEMIRFPDRTFVKRIAKSNCSDEDSTISETLQFSTTSTSSTTVSRGVQSSVTLKSDVSYKLPTGFGGSLGASITQQVSLNRTESESSSKTISHTVLVNEKVAPRTEKSVDVIVYETSLSVPFRGHILVDGLVDANLAGIVNVSQVLSTSERTIPIEGTLSVTASTDSKSFVNSRPLSTEECKRQGSPEVKTVTEFNYTGRGPNSLSSVRPRGAAVGALEIEQQRTQLRVGMSGTPGNWCYTAPCNLPLDGYRESCYYDEDSACANCQDESDPICEPDQHPEPQPDP